MHIAPLCSLVANKKHEEQTLCKYFANMLQIGSILFEDLAYDHIDKVEYFSRLVD